jgi:hypothetical protein
MSGEEVKYTKPQLIKLATDFSKAIPEKMRAYVNAPASYKFNFSGIAGNRSMETVPLFKQTPSEVVYTNDRNAWLVLGVDRSRGATTGYGGRGTTQCAAIDLVAGRMASFARGTDDDGNPIKVNPDFTVDAARVYISQKSDIDEYFNLVDGKVGNPPAKSAVGIKADEIRIVARGGIKLVTGTDMRNSQGGRELESRGIDLIAMNDASGENLQPLVKGDNLLLALTDLVTEIEQIRNILYDFLKSQRAFNEKILSHTHYSPFYGISTSPNFGDMFAEGLKTIIHQVAKTEVGGIINSTVSLKSWQNSYLSPLSEAYINSRRNHTN